MDFFENFQESENDEIPLDLKPPEERFWSELLPIAKKIYQIHKLCKQGIIRLKDTEIAELKIIILASIQNFMMMLSSSDIDYQRPPLQEFVVYVLKLEREKFIKLGDYINNRLQKLLYKDVELFISRKMNNSLIDDNNAKFIIENDLAVYEFINCSRLKIKKLKDEMESKYNKMEKVVVESMLSVEFYRAIERYESDSD